MLNNISSTCNNLSHTFATKGRELALEDELNGKKERCFRREVYLQLCRRMDELDGRVRGGETRTGLQSLAQPQETKQMCGLQTVSASNIRKCAQTDAHASWSL